MRKGLLARGLARFTYSPLPSPHPRPHPHSSGRPEDLVPVAVVEMERKGVGQTSQMTLGFHGERRENKANGS